MHDGKEEEMDQLTARVQIYSREIERLEEAYTALEQKRKTTETELDTLHINRRQAESMLSEFLHRYGFDGLPSPGIVPELFRMIRNLQEVVRDKEDATKQKNVLQVKIGKRIEDVEKILQKSCLLKHYMRC